MADQPSPADAPLPSFEEALAELESIVRQLEDGQLGLNEALKRYEQGVKLLRQCTEQLQAAERRIELLSGIDAQGNPITRPFEADSADTLEEKGRKRAKRRTASSDDE